MSKISDDLQSARAAFEGIMEQAELGCEECSLTMSDDHFCGTHRIANKWLNEHQG